MAKDNLTGNVMVMFRPEAEQDAINKVLGQYKFEKVFADGELCPVVRRGDKLLERLYKLSVPPGTEDEEVKKLAALDSVVETAYRPAPRALR